MGEAYFAQVRGCIGFQDFQSFNLTMLAKQGCERPRQKCLSKKDIRVPFRAPLFLGKWNGVATYFFL